MSAPYLNRELSWIEFNQRVLNEALRDDLPLLERVKFLAITASNLDEFFQVRIGGLMAMRRSGLKTADPSGLTPARNLAALRQRILTMPADQYAFFNEHPGPGTRKSRHPAADHPGSNRRAVRPGRRHLRGSRSIRCSPRSRWTPGKRRRSSRAPTRRRLPLARSGNADDPPRADSDSGARSAAGCRFYRRDRSHSFLLIEDLVAAHAARFFPGENVTATTAFRVTRNGDIAVQEEDAIDLAGEMEDVLTARRFADTVRLELRSDAPRDLARMIQDVTAARHRGRSIGSMARPGSPSFMELAFLADFDHLRDADWPGQNSPAIAPGASMFETIASGDLMLHHPYESFEPVLRLIEEAAVDPDVVAIKQVLYRTAKKSRIIDALIKAAENGKHVTVLVELKARFDEARNLDRADELQRAGAQIVYGVKGLKTHAKICMIIRRESGHLRRYVHLGTGNYNETTSRLYTDISYLTCKPEYGNDASLFFNAVSGRSKLLRFQRLIPAPTAMKPKLLDLITGEAERAKQGLPARIIAKVNSLQDPDIINALYKASRAGVEIKLNVRGICCLKPGDRETLEKHRGGLRHRPLPRTRPRLLLPPRRRLRSLHRLRGLDDAQPRKTRRTHDPDRGNRAETPPRPHARRLLPGQHPGLTPAAGRHFPAHRPRQGAEGVPRPGAFLSAGEEGRQSPRTRTRHDLRAARAGGVMPPGKGAHHSPYLPVFMI